MEAACFSVASFYFIRQGMKIVCVSSMICGVAVERTIFGNEKNSRHENTFLFQSDFSFNKFVTPLATLAQMARAAVS